LFDKFVCFFTRRKVWEARYVCVSLDCSPPHLRRPRTTVTVTALAKWKSPECPECQGQMVELLGSRKHVGFFINGYGFEPLPPQATS
jgi:hypothetical protein